MSVFKYSICALFKPISLAFYAQHFFVHMMLAQNTTHGPKLLDA